MFRMEINHVKRLLSFVNICNVVHNLRTWVTGPPGGGKVNERLYHNDERVTGTLTYILLSSGTQITMNIHYCVRLWLVLRPDFMGMNWKKRNNSLAKFMQCSLMEFEYF